MISTESLQSLLNGTAAASAAKLLLLQWEDLTKMSEHFSK